MYDSPQQRGYRDAEYRMAKQHARHTAIQRSGKTAIARGTGSLPTRWLRSKGLIEGSVLDYGCGKGADVDYLRNFAMFVNGYDPNHRPDDSVLQYKYDTVLCQYVFNTLPKEYEDQLLDKLSQCLAIGGVAYISVRRDIKHEGMTRRGTYQRHVKLEDYKDVECIRDCASYAIYELRREK